MTTFRGRVTAPGTAGRVGASGPIMISVPDKPGGFVTGQMRIGAAPRMALTGFGGAYPGGETIEAEGKNRRGIGIDQMLLEVVLRGTMAPDRETVTGEVYASVNGVEQQPWTFAAAVEGVDLPVPMPGAGAIGVFEEPPVPALPPEGLMARTWAAIPSPVKLAAGLAGAAVGGTYLYKRVKG